MTGKNYHRLAPKDFMTTFQLCNTSILREIGLNNPTCVSLQAELYELTIYAPGGFLKSHVNVSQSEHTFGSLVVCLPTQFSGGELVIRHQKKEIKYDWSSHASDPLNGLCWAAFLSDSEHEVLPVTEGYRVTLTYNLYYCADINILGIDIKLNPFYRTLRVALSSPMFMRDGGVLGFNTHYSYTFNLLWADLFANVNFTADKTEILTKLQQYPIKEFIIKSLATQQFDLRRVGISGSDMERILHVVPNYSSCHRKLKGADYIIFNSAHLLGLPVHIKTLLKGGGFGIAGNLGLKNPDSFQCNGGFSFDLSEEESSEYRLFGSNLCKCTH